MKHKDKFISRKNYFIMPKSKIPKEVQQQGVDAVKQGSDELLKDWKPKRFWGKLGKFFAKLAISIASGVATKNINKQ